MRDGKLLGAHYICPMQIRLKTSLRPSSTTYFLSLFVSLPHQSDNVVLLKTSTCIPANDGDANDGFPPHMFFFKISLFSNANVASLLVE